MVKIWKLTLFFLLCLMVALLFNLPIQQVLAHVQLPPTVQLAGVDGNIINGRAQEIRVNNFPIRGVNYRYMPSCIVMLKICYHVTYDEGDVQLAYDLLNGDAEVSRSEVEYPITRLLSLMPNPALVKPSGRLQLQIDDLSMQQDKLIAVTGKLIWRDMGLDDGGIKIDIGDYQVDFTGDPQKFDFVISDLDAALKVKGGGNISAAGMYQLDVRVESLGGIDPQVRSVLNLIATRSSGNKYRIQQQGSLPPNLKRQLFR